MNIFQINITSIPPHLKNIPLKISLSGLIAENLIKDHDKLDIPIDLIDIIKKIKICLKEKNLFNDINTFYHTISTNKELKNALTDRDCAKYIIAKNITPSPKNTAEEKKIIDNKQKQILNNQTNAGPITNNVELFKFLLEKTKDSLNITSLDKKNLENLLFSATSKGNLDVTKYILENLIQTDKLHIKKTITENGETLIHLAAKSGNLNLVNHLIQKYEIDPSQTTFTQETILHYAALSGSLTLVKDLIENKKLNPLDMNYFGESCLYSAIKSKNVLLIKYLIEEKIFKIDEPLIHLAIQENAINILKYLIENSRADIEDQDSLGKTPLHYAVENDQKDAFDYLQSNKANIG
jgi:ankyrin repeat protein